MYRHYGARTGIDNYELRENARPPLQDHSVGNKMFVRYIIPPSMTLINKNQFFEVSMQFLAFIKEFKANMYCRLKTLVFGKTSAVYFSLFVTNLARLRVKTKLGLPKL